MTSVESNNFKISDAITCSIGREDDWQRKGRKRTLLETLSHRRKKESDFLWKEKKKTGHS